MPNMFIEHPLSNVLDLEDKAVKTANLQSLLMWTNNLSISILFIAVRLGTKLSGFFNHMLITHSTISMSWICHFEPYLTCLHLFSNTWRSRCTPVFSLIMFSRLYSYVNKRDIAKLRGRFKIHLMSLSRQKSANYLTLPSKLMQCVSKKVWICIM